MPVGTVIAERYQVVKELTETSQSTAYLAEHLRLHRKVTLKLLRPELGDSPDSVARLEREAQATSRIDHPNVASAIDFGALPNGRLYLVLEHVDGRSLRSELSTEGLPLSRALPIARQIAEALEAAHTLGIVHRDLRPENVTLVSRKTDSDWVKVLDFGMARVIDPTCGDEAERLLTRAGAVFGTPEYIAPEQAIGQRVDARADLYSLGVILFEMLAGVRPFEDDDQTSLVARQLTGGIPTFAARAPTLVVPKRVERLVARLLSPDPEGRFQKAAQVVAALDELIANPADEFIEPEHSSAALPAFELSTRLDLPAVTSAEIRALPLSSPNPTAPPNPGRPLRQRVTELGRLLLAGAAKLSRATVEGAKRGFARLCAYVETYRNRLPSAWRSHLSKVPVPIATGALLGLLGLLLLAPLMAVMCSESTAPHAAAVPTVARPLPAPLPSPSAVAPAKGSPTLADDPRLLVERAAAALAANQPTEAVNLVTSALGKRPQLRSDEQVLRILYQTAQSTERSAQEPTYSLLIGVMAAEGADIIYRLSLDRAVPATIRTRAEKTLRTEVFARAASPDVKMALSLRRADTCEKKHALLRDAGQIGAGFVLALLREFSEARGCGLDGTSDCYPCLRNDTALADALARTEARTSFSPAGARSASGEAPPTP